MRGYSQSCLDWLEIRFYWLSASAKSKVPKGCSSEYFFLWASCLDWRYILGRSSASASHCKHATNLVNQFVSKNVIGVVDIHRCVSVSMSRSSLVDTICEYVIASVTGSEGADCKNTSNFFDLFTEISFQKRNSPDYWRHVFVESNWSVASSASNLGHGWITLAESLNAW